MCGNEPIQNRSTFTELNAGSGGSIMDETKILFPVGPGPTTQLRHRARIVIGGEEVDELATVKDTNPDGCEFGLVTRNIPFSNNIMPLFNGITNVVLNNTVIITYTVPLNKSFSLTGFHISGDLPARYKLVLTDGAITDTLFTYRTNASNLNGIVHLSVPIGGFAEGMQIKIIGNLISSFNGSPPAANYEATILGFETSLI